MVLRVDEIGVLEVSVAILKVELIGDREASVTGDLTIRGVTKPVVLKVQHLGEWEPPWWEGNINKGPKTRAGFYATTTINRHDFGVNWNSDLPNGRVVVGKTIDIRIDAEAILE